MESSGAACGELVFNANSAWLESFAWGGSAAQLNSGRLAQATQHLASPEPRPGPESCRAPAHPGSQPEPVAAPVTAASLPRLARVQPPHMPRLTLKPSGLEISSLQPQFPYQQRSHLQALKSHLEMLSQLPQLALLLSQGVRPLPVYRTVVLSYHAPPPLSAGCCPPPLSTCLPVCGGSCSFILHTAGPAPLREAPQALACLCFVPGRPCRGPEPIQMVGASRSLPWQDTCTQKALRGPRLLEGTGLGGGG